MKYLVLAAIVTGLAGPALAQAPNVQHKEAGQAAQSPATDPRLASQTIAALQAVLNLREAELRAAVQDMQEKLAAREREWSAYSKPLWSPEPPVAKAAPPK